LHYIEPIISACLPCQNSNLFFRHSKKCKSTFWPGPFDCLRLISEALKTKLKPSLVINYFIVITQLL
jgi:hypothetical protein